MEQQSVFYYQSPAGILEITGSEQGITSIYFVDEKKENSPDTFCLSKCISELDEYFEGSRTMFSVNLLPKGTEFQRRVWDELMKIPYGITISYLDLALRLGDRNYMRAVGTANGRNKISIIIPCHRVIGGNGNLIGYSGGLDKKLWLLNHEARHAGYKFL